jgi:hypothetical protein
MRIHQDQCGGPLELKILAYFEPQRDLHMSFLNDHQINPLNPVNPVKKLLALLTLCALLYALCGSARDSYVIGLGHFLVRLQAKGKEPWKS